jgi:hypothetical protein
MTDTWMEMAEPSDNDASVNRITTNVRTHGLVH